MDYSDKTHFFNPISLKEKKNGALLHFVLRILGHSLFGVCVTSKSKAEKHEHTILQ